jgi:FimV-like protein
LRIKSEVLNVLGRHGEAEAIYRDVLQKRPVPWAKMGLAAALRGQKQLADAEQLAASVVAECPEYLAAYDFLAGVREEMGELHGAQEILQQAAAISPNNSTRQRLVGDVALRNHDLDAAEKAYAKVLERHRGSSLKQVDDYANLSRVLLDKGHTAGARQIIQELRREWRGSKQGELAATVMDSLCCEKEGDTTRARKLVAEAVALHEALAAGEERTRGGSHKLAVDLAHACLAVGEEDTAQQLLRKVAAENHENRSLMDHIIGVYTKTGREEAGHALLEEVGREIIDINNRGVLAARGGKIEDSVELLIDAAERVPNVQFLVNASKAILTLMEQKGWKEDLAERVYGYLERAQAKNARDPRVVSARELLRRVARKYGIDLPPLGA